MIHQGHSIIPMRLDYKYTKSLANISNIFVSHKLIYKKIFYFFSWQLCKAKEVPNWFWNMYSQLSLQLAKDFIRNEWIVLLFFPKFSGISTYPKCLGLFFLALLITSSLPPGSRWCGGVLSCWHFYSLYLCLCQMPAECHCCSPARPAE